MAFFQGGTTYAPNGEVTSTNLNALINAAIPQNLNADHFATDSKIVTVMSGKPGTATAGRLIWDTNVANLFVGDGSNWIGVSPQSLQSYTAQSSISIGDVVILDTANASSVKTTTNAAGLEVVVGVARTAVTTGQTVLVQVCEYGTVNCTTGAVSIGSYLAKSTTAGKAEATTSGNAFAIALQSKSGGSESAITALIGVETPGQHSASYANYSATSVALTTTGGINSGPWYDVPSGTLTPGSISSDGSSAMGVTVRTSRASQSVTLTILDLKLLSDSKTRGIIGFRVVTGSGPTIFATAGGKHSELLPNATGEEEYIGLGAVIFYGNAGPDCYGLYIPATTITFTVPTAGSTTVRFQFQVGANATYTITGQTTASLVAVVH